jgi:2-methylcitrate dehydratase PrpD
MRAAPRTLRFSMSVVLGVALLCGLTGAAQMKSNDAQNRNVRIHNQTGWSMTHIYASSGGAWSEDLLSGGLAPGRSVVVRLDDGSGSCRYTLRAEFDNGQTLRREGVNACQVADYYFTR